MWLAWDDEERISATLREVAGRIRVEVGGESFEPDVTPLGGGRFLYRAAGRVELFHCVRDREAIHLQWRGVVYRIEDEGDGRRPVHRHAAGGLEAPMPGRVIKLSVAVGERVHRGQEILVVEAMKMENAVRAPREGRIAAIAARVGEMVAPGRVLVELEEDP